MKIGILSAAHLHVESYVPLLQTIAGVEVAGIADDDTERGRAAAQRFGIPSSRAMQLCSPSSRTRWSYAAKTATIGRW